MYVYFYSLHVSGSHVPIIRTMQYLVYVTVSLRVDDRLVCIPDCHLHWYAYQTVIYTE